MKKSTTLKLSSLIILVCLLMTSFISCKNTGGITDTGDTTSDSTSDVIDESPEVIMDLISGGVCNLKIARPDSSLPDYVFNAFADVKDTFKRLTGISLEISYDDSGSGEIIVGSEGRAVLEELEGKYKLKDYFVGVYKNNLIIYALGSDSLDKAVAKFIEIIEAKVKESKSDVKFSSLENVEYFSSNYLVNTFNIANESISKYCIVYSPDGRYSEELLALKLKNKMEKAVGFPIEIYTDTKVAADAKKIIIGKTKYSSDVSSDTYEFTLDVKAGDLRLYSDSIEGYHNLFTYLSSNQLSQKEVSFEEGYTVTKDVDTGKISTKINRSGEVRVLIHNILGNCSDTEYPVSYRTRSVVELLVSYNPDVIGLQECSPNSRKYGIVDYFRKYGYEEVAVTPTNSKKSNYTPLFYNPKAVKVIACDYVYYNGSLNDGGSKSITWAVFERLSDGKQFAVCSTHFFYQSADNGGDAGRLENAKTLVSTVQSIASKYNVPVISAGDLNTRTTTYAFRELTVNGFTNIQKIAAKAANSATHHAYPEFSSELGYYATYTAPSANVYTDKAIDHALVYNQGSLKFNLFDIIAEDFALMSSDHCPLLIDFSF